MVEVWYLLKTTLVDPLMEETRLYNLNRYEETVTTVSEDGEFKPKIRRIHKQTHVANKVITVCMFQRNILKNFHKWPKGTQFEIEEV